MTKVAITTQGPGLDSPGDPRFGRAPGFLVHDLETGVSQYVPNDQNMNLAQGAGVQTAQAVARLGVSAVITGHVGPKAFAALSRGGVAVHYAPEGTAGQWLEAYRAGRLALAGAPDKEGHW